MSNNKKQDSHDNFEVVENALSKTEQYIEDNRKSLTIITLVIALVIGGYLGYQRFYLAPQEIEARAEMFMAERYFEQDSLYLALDGDGTFLGMLDIIDEFGATKSANLAYYYVGISYLRLGEFENAIENLKQFRAKDRLVSCVALGAIGDAYVELEEYSEAINYYVKASTKNSNELTSTIYLKKAGFVYEELGNYKKAVAAYKSIKKDFPQSEEARDIDKYISAAELNL